MSANTAATGTAFLPLRFAWRELRGGLRGFYVFIICIALGVAAIAGTGSIADALIGGIAREGRTILGGDASFSLIHREANTQERAFLQSRGRVSTMATMRAMLRTGDERSALVEAKAVDAAYPLYGTVTLEPEMPLAQALAMRDGVFGAVADPALLTRLNLKPGARVTVGSATLEIRAALAGEPDKLAGGLGFGPRLLLSESALRATGLLQPGSLVRWHYRLRLPDENAGDAAVAAVVSDWRARWPDAGYDIRSRDNASPQLDRNIERFTQYLTLVGLTALLVGGVGVANAVRGHLERKRTSIAALKALGASGRRIFAIYLTQVLTLACIGAVIGIALGAMLPFATVALFGAIIPLPIEAALYPAQLALAFIYGLLTALTFALWPLGRAHDIPVSALFRDQVTLSSKRPRPFYLFVTALAVAVLAGFSIALAFDQRVAAIFVAAAAATFVVLRLVAFLIMNIARRLPHARYTALRLAIANIHRPGAITPAVVLSLGLGLALLVTVVQVDSSLRRQFLVALPAQAPAFFFLDIQPADAEKFDALMRQDAPDARVERVPMLRGRVVSANGVKAEDLKPASNAAWVLQSDRGITYTADVPLGSHVVEGEWWKADYDGPPLLSMEKQIADGLGLKIGDQLTVNVLGRNITATIANLRSVEWQSLGINFVLVYSPNAFRGAPQTQIATLTYPRNASLQEESALVKKVGEAFPNITILRVKEALEAAGGLIGNLILGLRLASLVTILAAVLVLAGALAAGHHSRVYDAVILKTLGATRARLIAAYLLEYGLLGLVTAVFAVAVGSAAAWMILTRIMNLSFLWAPLPAAGAVLGALAVTVGLGLIGTLQALAQKPATVLRNL